MELIHFPSILTKFLQFRLQMAVIVCKYLKIMYLRCAPITKCALGSYYKWCVIWLTEEQGLGLIHSRKSWNMLKDRQLIVLKLIEIILAKSGIDFIYCILNNCDRSSKLDQLPKWAPIPQCNNSNFIEINFCLCKREILESVFEWHISQVS